MRRSRLAFLAIGLVIPLLASQAASADEEYDLRGPPPVKGQVYVLITRSSGKDLSRTTKIKDRTVEERFDEISIKKKQIEVLAVAKGEISRMRTKVLEDKRDEIFLRKGKFKGKELTRSTERELSGQFIYSERLPSGWRNALEDAAPTDKQKMLLKEYVPFKDEDEFYPAKKLKVGETWKVEPSLLHRVLSRQMDDFKGTMSGKFLRVEKEKDEDIAVLEVEFEFTGKDKDEDFVSHIKIGGKALVHRTLKYGYDRKSANDLTISMKGSGETEGEKIEIDFNGKLKSDDFVELKSPKR